MPVKFEPNADGSVTATLPEPLLLKEEELDHLTIQPLSDLHVVAAPTIGNLATLASELVLPAGAYDELPSATALEIASHVSTLLDNRNKPQQ